VYQAGLLPSILCDLHFLRTRFSVGETAIMKLMQEIWTYYLNATLSLFVDSFYVFIFVKTFWAVVMKKFKSIRHREYCPSSEPMKEVLKDTVAP
jgi:uncharacterized protein with ParB-like and HNH nuclease domain